MLAHKGLLPREGFTADTLVHILQTTALNPFPTLALLLLAKFTRKGKALSVRHDKIFSRLKILLVVAVARWLSRWYSRGVLNHWQRDQYDWRGKEVVLITGGCGGIGEHMVKLLSEGGIKVVVLDIQPLAFETSSNVHYFRCDITSRQQIAAIAKEIRAQVGYPTVLVNNAGVARGKALLDTSEEDIRSTFDVNTLAHYWMVHEFLPSMIDNNHGMVVTVASITAWVTVPNMVAYSASKHAALAFHEGLTAELATRYAAPRVRTVVVNQGYTRTPLFEGCRNKTPFLFPTLEPETVAEAVVKQILTGQSGQVIIPALVSCLSALASTACWFQYGLRSYGSDVLEK